MTKDNTQNTRRILHALDAIRSVAAVGTLAWSSLDKQRGLLATGISEIVNESLSFLIALASLENVVYEDPEVSAEIRMKMCFKLFGLTGGILMTVDAAKNPDNLTPLTYVGIGLSAFGMLCSKVTTAYHVRDLGYSKLDNHRSP